MSDKVPESDQEQPEARAKLPEPEFSKVSGDSKSSSSDVGEQGLREQLAPIVNDLVERAFQSQKDRGINKVEKDVQEVRGALGALAKVLPQEELQRLNSEYGTNLTLAELREEIAELKSSKPAQTQDTSGGNQELKRAQQRMQDKFRKSGLIGPDEDFLTSTAYYEFHQQHGGKFEDALDMVEKATEFVSGRQPQSNPVSPAAIAQTPGKSPSKQTVEGLTTEYQQKMMENRGNKSAIIALQREYKEKGVPIENVGFS